MTVNAKVVVLKDGKPIFEYPVIINAPADFWRGSHDALAEFHHRYPNLSLLDSGMVIKFDRGQELRYAPPS